MSDALIVLVTGATGGQGGAVARALLAKGHRVRAIVRSIDSPAAMRLTSEGAELVPGNLNEPESLIGILSDVDTFYLMGTPFESGVEGETRQGIELVDAAKTANVGHLVYGSVANADLDTGIPHFDSKFRVEQHIRRAELPFTISAPVYFMDNALAPWSVESLKAGQLGLAMPGDRLLQQVSVKNIGDFVAAAIDHRESVFGQRIDIAGDEVTGEQAAAILSEAMGREVRFEVSSLSALREQSEDMALMYEWFDQVGYSADIPALRETFSDVPWQSFTDWAQAQNWDLL